MTRVAIIGGGIGGLAAANALSRAGIEVAVYEAAPELKEIGAGVALHPAGRRRAPDAPLPGAGGLPGHRGRRGPGHCAAGGARRPAHGPGPVRAHPQAAGSRVVLTSRERGLSNHLTSGWAAWRRDLLIAWRRRVNRRDPEGRGTAWLAGYDATSPDVLAA